MQTIAQSTSHETKLNMGWNVIVHDDDEHTNLFVIKVFCDILKLPLRDSIGLVDEIMTCGKAVVAGPMSKPEAIDICDKLKNCGGDHVMISKGISSGSLYATIEGA